MPPVSKPERPEDASDVPHAHAGRSTRSSAADVIHDVQAAVKGASKRDPYGGFAGGTVLFTLVWLLWYDGHRFAFWGLKLWTIFIVVSALLVLAPIVRVRFRWSEEDAAQFAMAGACGLIFAWVAFLLPSIASNEAFFGTLAAACAGLAAWRAPGRSVAPAGRVAADERHADRP